MPPLFEGSSLYMPTALPGISIAQATTLLQEQDRIIRSFPEVESVFGAVGRSDSATDNAPLDMYDTTVDAEAARAMARRHDLRKTDPAKWTSKLQFPGLSNTWTMPVENRLDMELTGIKTPVGMKIQGPNLEGIQQLGAQIQQILSGLPQVRSVFAERVSQGFYVNVRSTAPEAARYGLTVADVQTRGHIRHRRREHRRKRRRPRALSHQRPLPARFSQMTSRELRRVLIATPSRRADSARRRWRAFRFRAVRR